MRATMAYGNKIGKLVKKYMKVELVVPNGRSSSGSGRFSVSLRSSSRGSSRSDTTADYYVPSDEDDDDDGAAPVGVPEGCLAVYVGPDMRRFVIQARFLYNPVFRELLRRSEEEYGFVAEGGLRIPCEAGDFEKLLCQMENGSGKNYTYR